MEKPPREVARSVQLWLEGWKSDCHQLPGKLGEEPKEALSFMGTVSFFCVWLLDGIVTNKEGLTLEGLSLSQDLIETS